VNQGHFEEAIEMRRQAHKWEWRNGKRDTKNYLISLRDFALIYKVQWKLDESIRLSQRVIELSENRLGASHLDTLESMDELALRLKSNGQY
jgi:hypothetical protein